MCVGEVRAALMCQWYEQAINRNSCGRWYECIRASATPYHPILSLLRFVRHEAGALRCKTGKSFAHAARSIACTEFMTQSIMYTHTHAKEQTHCTHQHQNETRNVDTHRLQCAAAIHWTEWSQDAMQSHAVDEARGGGLGTRVEITNLMAQNGQNLVSVLI